MKITSVLLVHEIERSIPLWVQRIGFEKTVVGFIKYWIRPGPITQRPSITTLGLTAIKNRRESGRI